MNKTIKDDSAFENAVEKLADSGVFFENCVVSEVYKSFANLGRIPPLYYYRDANNRKEIDLQIERKAPSHIALRQKKKPETGTSSHKTASGFCSAKSLHIADAIVVNSKNQRFWR